MKTAFFAFPFEFGVDYRLAVKRTCHSLEVHALFGDDVRQSDALARKLSEALHNCDLAFFDITGLNPNVLIELGMGLAAGKPVFVMLDPDTHKKSPAAKLLKKSFDGIPSDIAGFERFSYGSEGDLAAEVRRVLHQHLGIGRNTHEELKRKIVRQLQGGRRQRIRELVSQMPDAQVEDVRAALSALRLERRVRLEGRGLGARYSIAPN